MLETVNKAKAVEVVIYKDFNDLSLYFKFIHVENESIFLISV